MGIASANWLDGNLQTVAAMELVFPQRLADAIAGSGGSACGASLYLSGYVVEMALKLASFRLQSCQSNDIVLKLVKQVQRLTQPGPGATWRKWSLGRYEFGYRIRSAPAALSLGSAFGAGHDLLFWETYYRYVRGSALLPAAVDGDLRRSVGWFSRYWAVDMRYADLTKVAPTDAAEAVKWGAWFVTNYNVLKTR